MSEPSTRLERYELLDRIAVGGMAEVFRARASGAHGFEKTMAIKRILPDLARDPEFEQRFINEAKLAVELSHANVVQVFDFGRFAGSLFIAMEYVDGLDLAALLRATASRERKVAVPSALYIAIEIARGLDFAHRRKVIHRDVSPSNILVSRAGEVKIADFGIAEAAKRRRETGGSARRIMGKWRYMSPEQARGEQLSTASDVFSAAVVIFELVTGSKLFPGDEAEEIIENIQSMPMRSASQARAELPPRIDDILAAALEREPAARPPAAALLSDLLELSYESTIVASPLGVAELVEGILEERAEAGAARRGIDAMILAQLAGDRPITGRETAVGEPDPDAAGEDTTGQALLARAVDADGVTVLELDGAAPRGSPPPAPDEGDAARPLEPAPSSAAPRRWGWWIAAAAAAAALVTGSVWVGQVTGAGDPERLPIATADGSAERVATASRARLTIKSAPSGAQILLDGVLVDQVTPVTVDVSAGEPHFVELRAEGHQSWTERELVLGSGEHLTTFHRLEPLRAQLEVTSSPAGATVFLDGNRLGKTPLVRGDLNPGPGRALRIEKDEHKPVLIEIDLTAAKPVTIARDLVRAVRYGQVTIDIDASDAGGWAYVEHDGAWIVDPRDPGKKLSTPATFRLPVGRQRIRLYNAFTRRSKWVTVKVPERGVGSARFSLARE